jgi:hypothetical protein
VAVMQDTFWWFFLDKFQDVGILIDCMWVVWCMSACMTCFVYVVVLAYIHAYTMFVRECACLYRLYNLAFHITSSRQLCQEIGVPV